MKSPIWSTIIESANYLAYLAIARAFKPKGRPTPKLTARMTKNATNIETQQQNFLLQQPSYSTSGSGSSSTSWLISF